MEVSKEVNDAWIAGIDEGVSRGRVIFDEREAFEVWRDTLIYQGVTLRQEAAFIDRFRAALGATPEDHVADAGKMVLPEPVAWRDPSNTKHEQGCTYEKRKHEVWPHIYSEPLYTEQQVRALLANQKEKP